MKILRLSPATFITLVSVLFVNFSATTLAQNWEKMLFQGTSAYCLAEKDGTLFAGTNEGIYKLESDGKTWTRIALPTRTIFSITVKGDKMFCGTAGDGVQRSDDNGQTWTDANGNLTKGISIQTLMVRDGAYLFAGANVGGVFMSTDNGGNWQSKGLSNDWIYSLVMNGETLFAGTFGNGISRSHDNGTTWLKSDTGITNPFVKVIYSPSTSLLYAGTLGGGAFRTLSTGSSWTDISAGIAGREIRSMVMGGKYNYLYVGTGKDGVFSSADSGRSWQQFKLDLGNLSINSLILTATHVIAGTDDGIYRMPYAPLGVEEEYAMNNPMKIFPQPVGNSGLNVSFPTNWNSQSIHMNLVNVMGETVFEQEFSGELAHIPTIGLSSGVYMLRAQCGRESMMQKLVKE
ncbi:MAG: T9SS type A sorting domain-containing protein [Ignavibacteria bacterium]|nr:T9SS type A sorting domain-containing protein [Ignavibacteria bacterium]